MTQAEDNLQAFLALDMEYRLTIAHRIGCECARYFARRREVLIPAVLDQAAKDGAEPVDTFAAFARRVHARHGGDESPEERLLWSIFGAAPHPPQERTVTT